MCVVARVELGVVLGLFVCREESKNMIVQLFPSENGAVYHIFIDNEHRFAIETIQVAQQIRQLLASNFQLTDVDNSSINGLLRFHFQGDDVVADVE